MKNQPTPSEVVGERVRQLRKRRGWSIEQLAERCVEVGAPQLTVPALYVIESGRREKGTNRRRRNVTVDEWLALALAFEVAPIVLAVPEESSDIYQVTEGSDPMVMAWAVYYWIIGSRPLIPLDADIDRYITERPDYVKIVDSDPEGENLLRRLDESLNEVRLEFGRKQIEKIDRTQTTDEKGEFDG
jgi:transcriptional regulator with XRE-family HTH domain